MSQIQLRIVFALGFSLCLLGAITVFGQGIQIEPETRPFLTQSQTMNKNLEASAVVSVNSGKHLLVADDRTLGLLVIHTASGCEVGTIKNSMFSVFKPKEGSEPRVKWEAIASDGTWFYLLASHSGGNFYKANSYLIRFKLIQNCDGIPVKVADVIRWHLDRALRKLELYPPLVNNDGATLDRVKFEGLAVWRTATGRQMLAVGMREASTTGDPVRIYSIDITTPPGNNAQLKLTEYLTFNAGMAQANVPFKLSSLEYVPSFGGLFVLLSAEDDNANPLDHGRFIENALWFIDDKKQPKELWRFGRGLKAEGCCVIPSVNQSQTTHLAIVFDNDPDSTQRPSCYYTVHLRKEQKRSEKCTESECLTHQRIEPIED